MRHDNFCDSAVAMMRYRALFCAKGGFELKGRSVSERRVQAVAVVDICDEAIDPAAGVTEVGEGLAVDLGLQCLHEAFGLGVVEGIAQSAHADGDVAIGQSLAIGDGGVLHAAIGVVDQLPGCGFRASRAVSSGAMASEASSVQTRRLHTANARIAELERLVGRLGD
jgi:hypothetical protein